MKNKFKLVLLLLCSFLFIFPATGTTAKALEYNTDLEPLIEVQCHVSNIGWMPAVGNGMIAGTTGQSLPMEAIKIKFTPEYTVPNVHIQYRVHVSNIGWMPWVKDGEMAGTTGRALAIEAIQIQIVDDNGNLRSDYNVGYYSHLSGLGWIDPVRNGEVSGTVGQARPMEAIVVGVER